MKKAKIQQVNFSALAKVRTTSISALSKHEIDTTFSAFISLSLGSLKWFIQVPYNVVIIQHIFDTDSDRKKKIQQRINAINKYLQCNFFITESNNYANKSKSNNSR